jgi:PAS domain S-box-containing protein
VALVVGAIGLLGWILNVEPLKAAFTGGITIKANAAISLILLGGALLLLLPVHGGSRWRTVTGRIAAIIASLIGAATLTQHVSGIDFGIDQLLFHEPPGAAATASPGRMGPPASVGYALSGLSLLLISFKSSAGRTIAQCLSIIVSILAMLPMLGYAYSIEPLYGLSRYTGIAPHTALAILALSIGLLLARPADGLMSVIWANDAGGMMARRLLVPAIVIPFLLGWLRTIGARAGLFDDAFGRPMLVLSLMASLGALVWWNARSMSALGRGRRIAEEAVRESEERLRLGMESGNTGTWDWDVLTNCVKWSDRVYEFHGVTPETFSGRVEDFQKLIHPEDAERVDAQIQRSLQQREPYQIEFRVRHPSGEVRWLATTGKVVFAEDGTPVRMLGATTDITQRKQVEQERDELLASERAARAAAEQASEAKSAFLATLSHELRTPLTPVLLTVSLMEQHRNLPEDLRDDVATIRRNIELESRLISDLLDITRISRGKLQLDLQDVDLHPIVQAAVEICRGEKSAKLELELNATRHAVRGDSTRLTQIFWNLINNAQKFTPPDGTITIRSQDAPDGVIRIDVIDTGKGIDPAILPKLFTAFEQGEVRAARQHAGLGLGLTISRRLAEAHGGSVSAHSEGRELGTTLSVELPTIAAALLPRQQPDEPFPDAIDQPLRVLLVEDHEPTLEVLTELLQLLGHQVTGATTVAAATESASTDGFDILISDLGLPDGSGLDLLRQSQNRYAGRAIALTGYGMDSDIADSRAAGFAEHLIKPVDLAMLRAAIARVSNRRV